MQPAEQRITELLDKWLQSLDLHRRYASLNNEEYWKAQPWSPHQRPAPWIIELARTRVLELQSHVATRMASGDPAFAEALELMSFLATLVGVQDIERYIPLAEASREGAVAPPRPVGDTVLMPAPPDLAVELVGGPPRADSPAAVADDAEEAIVADAIRLLKWGREWHELAPAIARIAGRPGVVEVRRVLRAQKSRIEAAAKS
jgi:hypothetical protein